MEQKEKYDLDLHCQFIMDEYKEMKPVFEKMKEIVVKELNTLLKRNKVSITAVEARIKQENSLMGKLALKGQKYDTLNDITDILGTRIIANFSDDVDRVASYIEKVFNVDWENSVDKRKMHKSDSFGYLSLHYICSIPENLYKDEEHPEINQFRFEIQMRTTLQHAWAAFDHDFGYKTEVEPPAEYLRMLNRLAGLLEMADDEFMRIRNHLSKYRRQVQALMKDGQFDEIQLNGDTFASFLTTKPFSVLNNKIASINQAEIQEVPLFQFLPVLKYLGMSTLRDVNELIKRDSEDAYKLAMSQLAETDLDILASSISLQDLCIVATLKNGGGKTGLKYVYDAINGKSIHNEALAELTFKQASKLPFMNRQH